MGLSLSKIINTFTQQAPDGKEYLRVANIAPNAYDEVTDEFKVRVSEESSIELLKSHVNYTGLISNSAAYFGEEVRTSSVQLLNPLDVSKNPKRTIVIYNHHNQPLIFRVALFYIDLKQTARNVSVGGAVDIEIPAYNSSFNAPGSIVINSDNYPGLNALLPGMGLDIRQTSIAPTTGHLDVYVFGGK